MMSLNDSFGGGPGVSAFFNGKEIEADAQLEQEQIQNEFNHAIASELKDLFKDFSETLSEDEIFDESHNSSHVSQYEQNLDIRRNGQLLMSPPQSLQWKSSVNPDGISKQKKYVNDESFKSQDNGDIETNANHKLDYRGVLHTHNGHNQDISGSYLSLLNSCSTIGNTDKKYEQFQNFVNPRSETNVSNEKNQDFSVLVAQTDSQKIGNDEWMLQIKTPVSVSHHYYPSIQKNIVTGNNDRFAVKANKRPSPTVSQAAYSNKNPSESAVHLFLKSHSPSPPPLPSTAPPSSCAVQPLNQGIMHINELSDTSDESYSQYKVFYANRREDAGEEQYYIQTDQIDFFQKDLPEQLRTYEQINILYKARGREIEELTKKLEEKEEDMGKEIRSLKHKLALATGNAEGTTESLKNCKFLLQQAESENAAATGQIKALEAQITAYKNSKDELLKKLQTAESTVESLTHNIEDLQNSDSISRARIDHENMLSSLTQRYERELLNVKEKLDETKSALEKKQEEIVCLKKQLVDTTQELEKNQISRADTINKLAKSLEDSQKQYQSLLEQTSAQEMTTLKVQLQQTQAAKKLSDDLCHSFQSEIKDLKEQLNMFESATSLGVFTHSNFPVSQDDSMTDLGIRKTLDFSTPPSMGRTEITKTSDALITSLKTELEKCISNNKQKRAELVTMIEENKSLKENLFETKRKLSDLEKTVTEQKLLLERNISSREDCSSSVMESRLKKDIENLKKEKTILLEEIEDYKKRIEEIGSSEARLTEINQELSMQISQMVSDFDADKRSALERCQRTLEEVHRMSVDKLRSEIEARHHSEKSMLVEQYTAEINKLKKDLETALSELDNVKALYSKLCEEYENHELQESVKFKEQLEKELNKILTAQEEWKNSLESRTVQNSGRKEHLLDMDREKENWVKEKKELENVLSMKERELTEIKEKLLAFESSRIINEQLLQKNTPDLNLTENTGNTQDEKMQVPVLPLTLTDLRGSKRLITTQDRHAAHEDKTDIGVEELGRLKVWLKERDALIEELQLKLALSKCEDDTGDENRNCLYTNEISFNKVSDSLSTANSSSDHSEHDDNRLNLEEMKEVIKTLKGQLMTKESQMISLKAKHELVVNEVKLQHKKEFEKAAQTREDKFQNELKYFLKEREDRSKVKLEQVIKEFEMKSKVELENVVKELEMKHSSQIQHLTCQFEDECKAEVKKAAKECEIKVREELEVELQNYQRLLREKEEQQKILKEEVEKCVKDELEKEFSIVKNKLESDNLDLINKLKQSEENKYSELTLLSQQYEQVVIKLKEEHEESLQKAKSDFMKEIDQLKKENENRSEASNVKKNLINLLEREREIENAVNERVKKEIEKMKERITSEELEKQVEQRLQQQRTKWLQEARDYIYSEIKQGVENKLEEERQKSREEASNKEKKKDEEMGSLLTAKLELERSNWNKVLEEINKNKEEDINLQVKQRLEVESEKWKKQLNDLEKSKEEEVNKKVKEKLVIEFEHLKKKFVSELNARVLKEKSRLEEEVQLWRDEVKRKMEEERVKFVDQMSTELEDKVLEERKNVKEEMKMVMERKIKEMREELDKDMRQRLQKERKEWEEELNRARENSTQHGEQFCQECATAVKFIESVKARHIEEKQKLKQCISDLEQVKKEHTILEEKCNEMDRKYKADMKEAKRLHDKELIKVQEKNQIISTLKEQVKEVEEEYQHNLMKLKEDFREERAKMLSDLETQANLAIDQTVLKMPDLEMISYQELKEQLLDTADKMKAIFMSLLQSRGHCHTFKLSDALEDLRDRCKACVRTSLTGLVQLSCIVALEQSIDEITDNIMSSRSLSITSSASLNQKKQMTETEVSNASHQKHSPVKVKSVIKRVTEKFSICKQSPKLPVAHVQSSVNTNEVLPAHKSQVPLQNLPHLDQVELDDTFYHTPTSSNHSSPSVVTRTRSHTQNSATKQHIHLPDTPKISPKHLARVPTSTESDHVTLASPREAMKVMEARIRLADWARSGQTPWKCSQEKPNVQSSYISFQEAQKLPEKEFAQNKEIDLDGFIKPGVDAANWVKMQREKTLSKIDKPISQSDVNSQRYNYALDDSDDMSSDGQSSFHTLNRCNTTEDDEDCFRFGKDQLMIIKNPSEIRLSKANPARDNFSNQHINFSDQHINLSNESISSTETEHFPLFQEKRPSSTPLLKMKNSQVETLKSKTTNRTPDIYKAQHFRTVQPIAHKQIKSENPLRKSADLPLSPGSYFEPSPSLQRYKSLEDLLPRRIHEVEGFSHILGGYDSVVQDKPNKKREDELFYEKHDKKVNFKPYPVQAMTSSFWEKQSVETVHDYDHLDSRKMASGYVRHTPLEVRPFSSQDKF
ncbi:trichohyalin-like isoform X1 [Biomphalaria glabrata]|uniref:Trichohyalin-like isoform X1 n=1 Tax=Biomphalaria glabrata TaxID=6526 RepID=A0A9W2ZDV2_BIOGL|nr:trichohyalin-like isoform X1 [Biomphalaria glabrata]XP_055873187.1 trichohyalin-like isoform X1 [Biomphalaria glabrata]XP_055873188.1 trichohyalin-like isoform X1 [Biomphalaria glabrata]